MFRKLLSLVALIGALSLSAIATPADAQSSSCRATTAAPTWTTNTLNPLSCDLSGNLRTSGGGGGGGGTSSTFSAAFPATGTAAGASDGVNMLPLLVDGSGNLKVNVVTGGGSGGTSSTFGAAFPGPGTAAGFLDNAGANMAAAKVDASNNLRVNLQTALPAGANVIGAVTQSGTWNVGLSVGSNIVGKVGIDQTTPGTTNGVSLAQIGANTVSTGNGVAGTGVQRVTIASDNTAFSVNAVQSGTWTVQPGNTANTTPWLVSNIPATSGGLTNFVLEPAASDNHTNVKNGAGQVYHVAVFNNSATVNYLRLYNAASGFNGCNSATNIIWETVIPASTSGAGFVEDFAQGLAFSTGISICVTSAYGQTNTTAATASAMAVNIGYK